MKIEEMIAKNRANCSGCEACANICPKHCIEMKPDKEGFYYPNINKNECIECGQCDATCPVLNYKEPAISKLPTALAAINKDWNIRRNSSSGGAFTTLAEIILNRGGIVFGAAFNKDWQVVHIAAESMEELSKIRGSKYVQSRIGSIYRQVKTELETGLQVLFSGTPCQAVGLKYFLKKDYDNLILIDTACKGVPSPILWNHYINYRGRGHKISHIIFRDKQKGWENSLFKIIFNDRGMYSSEINKDLFCQGFGLALHLRPSCHECHFKGLARFSDITLADFWGVRNVLPEMYDNKGTSLILVNSEKGIKLLNETRLIVKEANIQKAVENNPCLITSFPADPRRKDFFNDLARFNPISVMDKYYLTNIGQQAQQLDATLKRNRLIKWVEIERKYSLLPKENVLILTVNDGIGGSKVFIEKYINENYKNGNIYLLQERKFKNYEIFLIVDLKNQNLVYQSPKTFDELTKISKFLNITHIFINHLISFDLQFIMNWILKIKLPFDFFIHDHFCICPNYNFDCFANFCASSKSNSICRNHFKKINLESLTIEEYRTIFKNFLSKANNIYVPSKYTAEIIKKFYPQLKIIVKPHILSIILNKTFKDVFAKREKLRIVFLGNMFKHKGAKYLLLGNEFIQKEKLPIEFIMLGTYNEELNIGNKEGIIFNGKYDNNKVSELLKYFEAAMVATLSICPETYCYTASEAILSGYPVLSMNVGAHALRIKNNDCGWIIPINTPSNGLDELKSFLKFIVTPEGRQQILLKAANTSNFKNGME